MSFSYVYTSETQPPQSRQWTCPSHSAFFVSLTVPPSVSLSTMRWTLICVLSCILAYIFRKFLINGIMLYIFLFCLFFSPCMSILVFIHVVFISSSLLVFCWVVFHCVGFSGDISGEEPACQCRRHKRWGFYPWVGKISWGRAWQPAPVFLPGESPWTEEPGGLQSLGDCSD